MKMRRDLSVIGHSLDEVELRHGVWNPTSHTLVDDEKSGRLFLLLSDLQRGEEVRDIARTHGVSRSEVEALVDRLFELGVMESSPTSAIDYHLDKIGPLNAASELETMPVRVVGDGALATEVAALVANAIGSDLVSHVPCTDPAFEQLLVRDHAWLTDAVALTRNLTLFEPWSSGFTVLAQDSIDPFAAKAMNRVASELKIPWMFGALDGPFLFVGPTTVPGRGACFECFERRVTMNLREAASYQRYKAAMAVARVKLGALATSSPILAMLAAHIAFEATNFAITKRTFTMSKVLAIYLPTMEMSFNEVLKLAGCPGCDAGGLKDEKELYFELQHLLQAGE